jgi:hypothetical protein
MHDNTHERRTTKPSVPLVQFDAAGRPMWKAFGEDVYLYEPELEAIWSKAINNRSSRLINIALPKGSISKTITKRPQSFTFVVQEVLDLGGI